MFSLGEGLTYWLYSEPTDMRKSFYTLSGLVTNHMNRDPLSGEVFIFISANRYNMKLLHWERGGFVLYQKRLEAGTFEIPEYDKNQASYKMDWRILVLLIEGINIKKLRLRKRYKV